MKEIRLVLSVGIGVEVVDTYRVVDRHYLGDKMPDHTIWIGNFDLDRAEAMLDILSPDGKVGTYVLALVESMLPDADPDLAKEIDRWFDWLSVGEKEEG